MKKFEKARLDVVELNSQDVIATSGCGGGCQPAKEMFVSMVAQPFCNCEVEGSVKGKK